MKCFLPILMAFLISACVNDNRSLQTHSVLPAAKKCQITCYEKTPACYVSAEGSNCLSISNVAKKDNKEAVCTLKSCNIKTSY